MLRSFRYLFFPVSIIYGLIVWIRNWLFDKNLFKSAGFNFPLICVGNLAVGGTGKTPMVEYLARLLKDHYQVATLSRGYKRKTVGFGIANETTTALEIGDEPMQFHQKFPDVTVAVGEERLVAIPQLLHDRPGTQVIILDDAFQHRAIKAGLNILLTEYGNIFTRDFYIPTGDLRDTKGSYKRADIIVVTKTRSDLDEEEKKSLIKEISPYPHQKVFFTCIVYGSPYHITHQSFGFINAQTEVLLVTGIANPKPLKSFLEERVDTYYMMHFGDHHIFSIEDWRDIKKRFEAITAENKIILTTEKDAMRLLKFENEIANLPFYVIPIEHKFLFNEGTMFDSTVNKFIQNFKQPALYGQKDAEKDQAQRK